MTNLQRDCDPFYEECEPVDDFYPVEQTQEEEDDELFMKYYGFAPLMSLTAGFVNYDAWQSYEGTGKAWWQISYYYEFVTGFTSLGLWFLREEYPYYAFVDNMSNVFV